MNLDQLVEEILQGKTTSVSSFLREECLGKSIPVFHASAWRLHYSKNETAIHRYLGAKHKKLQEGAISLRYPLLESEVASRGRLTSDFEHLIRRYEACADLARMASTLFERYLQSPSTTEEHGHIQEALSFSSDLATDSSRVAKTVIESTKALNTFSNLATLYNSRAEDLTRYEVAASFVGHLATRLLETLHDPS